MVRLRNINPLGHVDLPLIHRQGHPDDKTFVGDDGREVPMDGADRHGHGCLEPGEVFEVPADVAEHLLEQVGNYELADAAAKSKPARKRSPRKTAAKKAAAPPQPPAVDASGQDGEPK